MLSGGLRDGGGAKCTWGRGRVITVTRPYEPKTINNLNVHAPPFNWCQTILSQHCCEWTAVGHNATFTLWKIWILSDCFHHSEHSCDSAQPDAFPAQLLSFSSQSPRAWRPHQWAQCCWCICLTFYGSSKGCMSPNFRGICRMRPAVKSKSVWVQKEILQICCWI